jgi:Tfp pilus assembly PilM family ATPase
MADTIIGLDIGTWSVKVVELDPRDGSTLAFHEAVLPRAASTEGQPEGEAPTDAGTSAPGDVFDDAPTQVREAPKAPDEPTPVASDVPGDQPADDDERPEDETPIDLDIEPWRAALATIPNLGEVITAERLVTAMPEDKTTTLRVPVPFDDPAKVKNILPHLLEDKLPMSLASVIWAFRVMPALSPPQDEEDAPYEALVAVASRTDIGAFLAELAQETLDPSHLLVPELGLAALAGDVWRDGDGAIGILDIGHETTNLVVVKGEQVVVARSMKSAGRKLTERIAKSFDVSFDEAERLKHEYAAIVQGSAPNPQMERLSEAVTEAMRPVVRDVRRTLQSAYARDQIEVEQIYITGGTSTIAGLDKHLAAQLGIDVERLNPSGIASAGPAIPRAATPLAFARIGNDEQLRGRALNLRRDEFVYRGRSSYIRAQIVKFAAVAGIMLAFVFVFLFANKASHEAQRDAMRAALRDQTKQLFGEPVTSDKQIKMRLEGEGGTAKSLIPARSAYELTYEVVTRISGDLDLGLTRLEVDVDRNIIQIRGDTTDAQAVDQLVTDLEKLECLKEIKKEKLTVKGDRADFELQINSGCS